MKRSLARKSCAAVVLAALIAGVCATSAFAADGQASPSAFADAAQSTPSLTVAAADVAVESASIDLAAGASTNLPWDFSSYDDVATLSCTDGLNTNSDGWISLNGNAEIGKTYTAVLQAGMLDVGGVRPVKRFEITVRALPPAVELQGSPWWEGNRLIVPWMPLSSGQCDGYQIQVSTSKSFKSAKTVKAKAAAASKAIAGLRLTSRYYVRARAYKAVGGTTLYGNWSEPLRSGKWRPQLDGSCEGPGNLAVYWQKVAKKQCTGFQVQVSTSKSFKSKKTAKVKSTATAKTFTKLKSGKQYYYRVRAYTKSGGKIAYGAWSDVWQSSKIEARTDSSVSGYAFAKKAYAKIKKTGKKYGWTVGRLMRSSGMIMAPGGTAEVPLYSITCTNKSYRVNANLSGWTHEVFWAYVYDAKGNLVKEYHSAMALPSYEQAMVRSLSKGVLADLKRYSVKRKVPHLSLETIKIAEGGAVTVKMLNTSKAVTWDIVNENTLAKETNSEYAAAAKKALKLKKKSKTSVRLSIAKNAMPYSTFHTGYYLRATVGGKHYYAMLASAD